LAEDEKRKAENHYDSTRPGWTWNYRLQPIPLLPDYKSREERDEESVRKIAIVPPLPDEVKQRWPIKPEGESGQGEEVPIVKEKGNRRFPVDSLGLNRSAHSSGYRSRGGLSISELPFVSNSRGSSVRSPWRPGSHPPWRFQELQFLAPHYWGNIGKIVSHVMVDFDLHSGGFYGHPKQPGETHKCRVLPKRVGKTFPLFPLYC
jgi:hypothetical protein